MKSNKNIIGHLDVDSFSIQALCPGINLNDPIIAINSSNLIISVTKPAKELGFTRRNRIKSLDPALTNPELTILEIPDNEWGKANTKIGRLAYLNIIKEIQKFQRQFRLDGVDTMIVECHPHDEIYVDFTKVVENMHRFVHSGQYTPNLNQYYDTWDVDSPRIMLESGKKLSEVNGLNYWQSYTRSLGYNFFTYNDNPAYTLVDLDAKRPCQLHLHLILGSVLALDLIKKIEQKTQFKLSCGIGQNKLFAKIATGRNRPNGVTILPLLAIPKILDSLDVTSYPGLGGDLIQYSLQVFGENQLTLHDFALHFSKNQHKFNSHDLECLRMKLLNVLESVRGNKGQPVFPQIMSKNISCGKNFGRGGEYNFDIVQDQVINLAEEILDRILNEEIPFHRRMASTFKIELECERRKYSYRLDRGIALSRLSHELMRGIIRERGFKPGRDRVQSINLSVTRFDNLY